MKKVDLVDKEVKRHKRKKFFRGVLAVVVAVIMFIGGFWGGYIFRTSKEDKTVQSLMFILSVYKDKYYSYDGLKTDDEIIHDFADAIMDDYSAYYTAKEYDAVMQGAVGKYVGMGITYIRDTMEIYSVSYNSPADRAGIKAGGIMYAINGNEISSYTDFVTAFNSLPIETDFTLSVDYDGDKKDYTVQKRDYTETYVRYTDHTGTYSFTGDELLLMSKTDVEDGLSDYVSDGKTAYLRLTEFNGYINKSSVDAWTEDINGAAGQFYKALQKFKDNSQKNLIIDLRGNGGGYTMVASSISSHLIDEVGKDKPIMYAEYSDGSRGKLSSGTVDYYDYGFENIIFLADENSASASELLMGAVLDYDTKKIVKVIIQGYETANGYDYRTYGKGIMQDYYQNSLTKEVVKLTVAGIFWPKSNTTIHGVGLTPSLDSTRIFASEINGENVDCLVKAKSFLN